MRKYTWLIVFVLSVGAAAWLFFSGKNEPAKSVETPASVEHETPLEEAPPVAGEDENSLAFPAAPAAPKPPPPPTNSVPIPADPPPPTNRMDYDEYVPPPEMYEELNPPPLPPTYVPENPEGVDSEGMPLPYTPPPPPPVEGGGNYNGPPENYEDDD